MSMRNVLQKAKEKAKRMTVDSQIIKIIEIFKYIFQISYWQISGSKALTLATLKPICRIFCSPCCVFSPEIWETCQHNEY